nr:hypothetical protein Iba_chr11aCG8760 [Ipomoea batatas]GME05302.1 hypothetical protein Iba_scaffold2753CG0640 [Ipomoea batatas]
MKVSTSSVDTSKTAPVPSAVKVKPLIDSAVSSDKNLFKTLYTKLAKIINTGRRLSYGHICVAFHNKNIMKVKQELTAALASAFASKSAGDRSEVFSRFSAAALNAEIPAICTAASSPIALAISAGCGAAICSNLTPDSLSILEMLDFLGS